MGRFMHQPKSQLSPTYFIQNKTKRNKKFSTVPDRKEVKSKDSLSSIHDFLFTPGVVQPPQPMCDLKAIKYKTKIEFNQRFFWSPEGLFPVRKRYRKQCPLIHSFSKNNTHCIVECKVRFPFHLLLSIKA